METYKIRQRDAGDLPNGVAATWVATDGVDQAEGETPIQALLFLLRLEFQSDDPNALSTALSSCSRLATYLTHGDAPPAAIVNYELKRLSALVRQIYPIGE